MPADERNAPDPESGLSAEIDPNDFTTGELRTGELWTGEVESAELPTGTSVTTAPEGALDRLVPAARLPQRARLRIGVGAAVVLLLTALVITVVVSAVGQQSSGGIIAADAAATSGASAGVAAPPGGTATDGTSGATDVAASASGAIIFVHVLGAVARPGLFELAEGARVIDAVAAAGGMTDTADPAGTNLARKLSDGEQLYLPQIGEVPAAAPGMASGAVGAPSAVAPGGPAGTIINLNTATLADLDTLPRIGPAMAQRILDFRDANGPFTSTDELRNITGIGDKTFEALKDLVTV